VAALRPGGWRLTWLREQFNRWLDLDDNRALFACRRVGVSLRDTQ